VGMYGKKIFFFKFNFVLGIKITDDVEANTGKVVNITILFKV